VKKRQRETPVGLVNSKFGGYPSGSNPFKGSEFRCHQFRRILKGNDPLVRWALVKALLSSSDSRRASVHAALRSIGVFDDL